MYTYAAEARKKLIRIRKQHPLMRIRIDVQSFYDKHTRTSKTIIMV